LAARAALSLSAAPVISRCGAGAGTCPPARCPHDHVALTSLVAPVLF